jgi:hypothetical protein
MGGDVNVQTFERAMTLQQRKAASRKVLAETLDQTSGFLERSANKVEFEKSLLYGESPEEQAKKQLQQIRAVTDQRYSDQGERNSINQLLDRQIEVLERMEKALNRNTDATLENSRVGDDPGRPPGPLPSAALGN